MPIGPQVRAFFHEPSFTVSYLVWDGASKSGAIIDSVLDFDHKAGRTGTDSAQAILDAAHAEGVRIEYILETHAHADHLSAGPFLKQATGAPIMIGEHITIVQRTFKDIFNFAHASTDGTPFDRLVRDGEKLKLGELDIEVLHTPGHTPACVSYRVGDTLFVGDTFFMPDYGTARCDFPGGDARALYHSIQRLFSYPEATRVFLCHDYKAPGRDTFVWETSLGAQRANVHLQGKSEDEFVAMREARDKTLSMPELIVPAIQVNIQAGELPPAEANGVRYLKVPLNRL